MLKKIRQFIMVLALVVFGVMYAATEVSYADEAGETASAVSIGITDYDNLTMQVYPNGNGIVFYSIDSRKTWNEIEGPSKIDAEGKSYIEMDISWASISSEVKMYIKGDKVKTEESFSLPKQVSTLKVKFNKVDGDFTMTTSSDAKTFYWRKSTDYNWKSVSTDQSSAEYKSFLDEVEGLRLKGAKLIFKTGQTEGTGVSNMGERSGKEVSVTISKYSAAPSVKLNVVKMTLNTKATMEYAMDVAGPWIQCEKAMSVETVAPQVFSQNGNVGTETTIFFRSAQTDKKPPSLIGSITLPGQTGAPDVGENGTDASYSVSSDKKKFQIKFPTASSTKLVEYCVVKPSDSFELTKAKWKTVKSAVTVSLTEKAAPEGSLIYVRFKGQVENQKKNLELKLPSAYSTFIVKWPEKTEEKKTESGSESESK